MNFHAFMYVTIGRRHELERGMAGTVTRMIERTLRHVPFNEIRASGDRYRRLKRQRRNT